MSIDVRCQCGAQYRLGDQFAGKRVRCKKCGGALAVPAAEPERIEDPFWEERGEYALAETPGAYSAPSTGSRPHYDDTLPRGTAFASGSTYASNPGLIRLEWGKYLSSFPIPALAFGGGTLILTGLGTFAGHVFWAGAGVVAAMGALYYHRVRSKFVDGDVNPGIVISTKPWLVAVHVDMTTGGAPRPAVKVISQPLGTMTGGPPRVGARLATVAVYAKGTNDHWGDVHPTVVNCATTSQADIDRVAASIPGAAWRQLESLAGRLSLKGPGLHTLWDGDKFGKQMRWQRYVVPVSGILGLVISLYAMVYGKRNSLTHPGDPERDAPSAAVAPGQAPSVRPTQPPTAVARHPAAKPSTLASPQQTPAEPVIPATVEKPKPPVATTTRSTEIPKPTPELPKAPAASAFVPGERVQVLWGSSWWPAKVIRVEGEKTRIHYDNHTDQWDESVGPARIRRPK